MFKENVEKILAEIAGGNNLGEKITLVAATKTVCADVINQAIAAGVTVVAENRVQEFREKTALLSGCAQHFIGHLQTNKVKFVVGKVALIHSVDSIRLAEAIDAQAAKLGVVQDILIEINVGGETAKSGFLLSEAKENVLKAATLKNVKVKGLMAMLPASKDEKFLGKLFDKMRTLYDKLKADGLAMEHLSMGISEDYKTAIAHGSNMIRLGSALFGKRI